jgi:hypothetical protein
VEEGRRGLLSGVARMSRARFVICEDGGEYTERFNRFLSVEFEFVRADCFARAVELLAPSCSGLLLDLDFRRTAPALLVDESGAPALASAAAEVQGVLILRALRARGQRVPALLFADFDDRQRAARLEGELAPLSVIASNESLPAIAALLRKLHGQA